MRCRRFSDNRLAGSSSGPARAQCVEPGEAPRFPPCTAGQHILERYHATHAGYGAAAEQQAAAVAVAGQAAAAGTSA